MSYLFRETMPYDRAPLHTCAAAAAAADLQTLAEKAVALIAY
jgi:hypothetical protein